MSVTLRAWCQSDLDALVYLANDEGVSSFLSDAFPAPYSYEAGQAFLDTQMNNASRDFFAISFNGYLAGGIGVTPKSDIYRLNTELGYWLGRDFWGYGIGTEAVRQMVEFVFSQTEIARIYACPFPHNLASIRVLEKNGFILEARFEKILIKHGLLMDELVYAKRRPF